jgi:hypothetical protein
VQVCLQASDLPPSPEAAKEKVIFCAPEGQTHVYQADRNNRTAALCACGNAAGAAAAMLAHCLDRHVINQDLRLPDGQVTANSNVGRASGGGYRVAQSWAGIRFQVLEAELLGRPVAVCHGSLNDYLIVLLPGESELHRFELDDALALWAEARQFSGFTNPLQSRLAAIVPRPGNAPFVRFYTCGRLHPGAPLTGLAALALAATSVPWLDSILKGRAIEVRRGVDPLPQARATKEGHEVAFAPINAVLKAA